MDCSIDRVISNVPSDDNSGFCEVEIESDHYSKKSVSSRRSASSSGGDGGSGSSGGNGNGRTGVSTGYSGSSGFAGFLSTPLAINEIYYDKCADNMAKITVTSDADAPPTVRVSTAKSGVVIATLSEVQPYAELNEFSDLDRYVYEIPISSEESFLMVVATEERALLQTQYRPQLNYNHVKELQLLFHYLMCQNQKYLKMPQESLIQNYPLRMEPHMMQRLNLSSYTLTDKTCQSLQL